MAIECASHKHIICIVVASFEQLRPVRPVEFHVITEDEAANPDVEIYKAAPDGLNDKHDENPCGKGEDNKSGR